MTATSMSPFCRTRRRLAGSVARQPRRWRRRRPTPACPASAAAPWRRRRWRRAARLRVRCRSGPRRWPASPATRYVLNPLVRFSLQAQLFMVWREFAQLVRGQQTRAPSWSTVKLLLSASCLSHCATTAYRHLIWHSPTMQDPEAGALAACIAVIRASQPSAAQQPQGRHQPQLQHSASAAGSLTSADIASSGGSDDAQEAPGGRPPPQPATPGQASQLAPLPRPGFRSSHSGPAADDGGCVGRQGSGDPSGSLSGGDSDGELTSEDVARLQRRLAEFGVSD